MFKFIFFLDIVVFLYSYPFSLSFLIIELVLLFSFRETVYLVSNITFPDIL